jgi:hypothetical protein
VDGGTHTSTQVGGARVKESILFMQLERSSIFSLDTVAYCFDAVKCFWIVTFLLKISLHQHSQYINFATSILFKSTQTDAVNWFECKYKCYWNIDCEWIVKLLNWNVSLLFNYPQSKFCSHICNYQ